MSDPADFPARVGRQLAKRREDLDLTQNALAQRIGVTANSVSAVERGVNTISLRNRPTWEEVLQLAPGTLSQAYRTGEPIEVQGEKPTAKSRSPEGPDIEEALEALRKVAEDPEKSQAFMRRLAGMGLGESDSVGPDSASNGDDERRNSA